jgi:hypothetical protein
MRYAIGSLMAIRQNQNGFSTQIQRGTFNDIRFITLIDVSPENQFIQKKSMKKAPYKFVQRG